MYYYTISRIPALVQLLINVSSYNFKKNPVCRIISVTIKFYSSNLIAFTLGVPLLTIAKNQLYYCTHCNALFYYKNYSNDIKYLFSLIKIRHFCTMLLHYNC